MSINQTFPEKGDLNWNRTRICVVANRAPYRWARRGGQSLSAPPAGLSRRGGLAGPAGCRRCHTPKTARGKAGHGDGSVKPDLPATLTCRPRPRPWEDPAIVFIDEVVSGGPRGAHLDMPPTPPPHPLRPSLPSIAGHYLPCCLVVQALVTWARRVSASARLERRC